MTINSDVVGTGEANPPTHPPASPPAAQRSHSTMAAGGLVAAVAAACAATCPDACGGGTVAVAALEHIHPHVLAALAAACAPPDGGDVAWRGECVAPLTRYACSDAVGRCARLVAAHGEALSACLTTLGGTLGRTLTPWTNFDVRVLQTVVFLLAAAHAFRLLVRVAA